MHESKGLYDGEVGERRPNALHRCLQDGVERRAAQTGTRSDQHFRIGLAVHSGRSDSGVDLDGGEHLILAITPHRPKPGVGIWWRLSVHECPLLVMSGVWFLLMNL